MGIVVGMDVHRRRSQVCVLDPDGKQTCNRNLVNGSVALRELLDGVPSGTPVAFESAYGWSWLVDLLDQCELEPHLAHPSGCRAISSAKLKNDRVDARTLADLLRAGYLAEAWLAPVEVRDQRALLRHRAWLVGWRTASKNRVRAILADHGITPPTSLWYGPGRGWLAAVALPPVPRRVVTEACHLIDTLDAVIGPLETDLAAHADTDPWSPRCALPGVGLLTAVTLLAEIGGITRFPTARKLCAWAGLVPSVRNCDTRIRRGHLTKTGPAVVRHVLTEAAHVARRHPDYAADYAVTAGRRGTKIATVKVARKLLTRAFHILHELQTPTTTPDTASRPSAGRVRCSA